MNRKVEWRNYKKLKSKQADCWPKSAPLKNLMVQSIVNIHKILALLQDGSFSSKEKSEWLFKNWRANFQNSKPKFKSLALLQDGTICPVSLVKNSEWSNIRTEGVAFWRNLEFLEFPERQALAWNCPLHAQVSGWNWVSLMPKYAMKTAAIFID